MRTRLIRSLLVLLVWVSSAPAQLTVIDPANLTQNTWTAIQSFLTTVQTFLIEANQILELESLGEMGVAGGIVEDMKLLGTLVEQAEGLSYDIHSLEAQINALFDLTTAPATRDGLTARLAEMKRLKFEAYSYAARVHTLLRTAMRTVEHVKGLLDTLAKILGNKQAHQTAVQTQTVMAKHLANLDVHMTAFNRAQTIDKLSDALITESIRKIHEGRMEDWPGF